MGGWLDVWLDRALLSTGSFRRYTAQSWKLSARTQPLDPSSLPSVILPSQEAGVQSWVLNRVLHVSTRHTKVQATCLPQVCFLQRFKQLTEFSFMVWEKYSLSERTNENTQHILKKKLKEWIHNKYFLSPSPHLLKPSSVTYFFLICSYIYWSS